MSTSGGACAPTGKTPQLPMRDAGLASAVAALAASHQTTAHIAWRPDGQLLAVAPSANGASDIVKDDDPVVLFYDCQTGKLRGQLTVAQLQKQAPLLDTARPADIKSLAWSPDGNSVLLVDGARQMLALVATP
jgi:hypothetical protein